MNCANILQFFFIFFVKMPLGVFRCGGGGFLCVSRTSLGLRYRRRRAFSLTSFSLRYTDGGGVSSCFALGFLSASSGICKEVEKFSTPTALASSRLRRESSPGTSTAASTGTSNRRRPRHRWGCLHCKGVEMFYTPTAGGIGGVNLPKHRPPHRIGGGGGSDGGNVGAFSGIFARYFREGVILYLYRRKTAKMG